MKSITFQGLLKYTTSYRFAMLLTIVLQSCAGGNNGEEYVDPINEAPANGAESSNTSLNSASDAPSNPVKNAATGESINNAVSDTGGNPANDLTSDPGVSDVNATEAALGESLNNVPTENLTSLGAPSTTPPNSIPLNAAALAPNTVAPSDQAPPSNQALTNKLSPPDSNSQNQPAPIATGDYNTRMNASPFANQHMNWPGKGKVKYVTRPLTRHANPNGPVVGEFSQGEHPLVFQNGNWVELNDGSFVKGNGLSDKPTGYKRSPSH